jgi:class 3 adenylate cyclase
MRCPKCQFDNREEVKFCEECGAKFELECPACNAIIPIGRKFCGDCGEKIAETSEILSHDYTQPQSYTPKFLADKILRTRSSIEGERKLVTVLFADVANYTSMAEKLDPEDVHQIMDGCFQILMDEIHKYEGTINQFTGDGVMALFGAPLSHEDHAQRACYAALAILRGLDQYGEELKNELGINFKMRIGLNSGNVVVGSIGDNLRMDYTAVGDTTNLASRMQSNAKPGTAFISENTYKLARDFFKIEPLGKVEVKGKAELQEIYQLIRASDVETRLDAAVTKGLTKFVGRKNSMASLIEVFDKVKSGLSQVVGLVGEAGVGKSRLLLELRKLLPKGEYIYLEGRCIHYGSSMAYLPILDILRTYFEIKEEDRKIVIKNKIKNKILDIDEKLKGIIPPFEELFSLKVDDENFINLDSKGKRDKTFEAIRDLLIRLSQSKPLVLAIEDLHWIDKTSEELLDYLIGKLGGTSILLILLYRPEYEHQWGSKSYYTEVRVDQLSISSSTQMVQAILDEAAIILDLQNLIIKRAAGNPLFIEEFTHTLLENGSIERKNNEYVLSRKADDIQVPNTIQGIIAARMDRLESNLKQTMQIASVVGREFAFRILESITNLQEALKSHLLELQGLEFIYEKQLFPELEYIFKHALIQEVAYNSLLLKRRSEIHEKIGNAIESLYSEKLEEFYEILAYHYSMGEIPEKACQYLKLSGNKATKNHSVWEAFNFYKDAIDKLNQLPETQETKKERLEILYLIITPMYLLGFPENSLEILKDGEMLSKELGDNKRLAIFYSRMGSYYSYKGEPLIAMKYSEDAFAEARIQGNIELMAPLAFQLCTPYQGAGQFYKIVDMVPDIIDLIEESQKESEFFALPWNPYSALCGYQGMSLGWLGSFENGEVFLEKGLRNAVQIDDIRTLGYAHFFYGSFLQREIGRKQKRIFKIVLNIMKK